MNEWNNDPIEILSFVNIDDIMESIFRKNIETHLIVYNFINLIKLVNYFILNKLKSE